MNPCFAIIDRNTLSHIALKNVLQEMFYQVEVFAYNTIDEFIRDSNRHFVHFFISSDILFKHADEFETLRSQTTVMSEGYDRNIENIGFRILNVSLPADKIIDQLDHLRKTGQCERPASGANQLKNTMAGLSNREKEVLKLIVKGHINKEIADILSISVPTVIFHRNNICDKLQTRSVGKLTVISVLSGLVDINEI